jgi:hypothetical protein
VSRDEASVEGRKVTHLLLPEEQPESDEEVDEGPAAEVAAERDERRVERDSAEVLVAAD